MNEENYRITLLRNEISLCLDDLAALVVNSAMASNLRNFSKEVMELAPGFTFNLKQAKKLKEITQKTLRQYRTQAINDGDLMNYIANSRLALKDEDLLKGEGVMGIKDVFHWKARKKEESLGKMERDYKDVCEKMLACEEEMSRCVENTRGHSPDSMIYRNNERTYNAKNNELKLLRKQEEILRGALDNATRIKLVQEFNERQKEIQRNTGIVFGNEKELGRTLAEAEMNSERINETIDKVKDYGSNLFEDSAPVSARTDSEFGAKVAYSERRQDILEDAGVHGHEEMRESSQQMSEFDRLVDEHTKA